MRTGSLLLALLAAAMLVSAGCTTTPPTNTTTTTTTTTTPTPTSTPTPTATRCAVCEAGPNQTPAVNATSNATFLGTTWEWTALESASGADPVAVDDPARYTIVFTPNMTYGINADCNVGGGDYTAYGSALNLTPPITTLIWCGDESQDRVFLASLANVSSYGFDDDGNLLLNLDRPGDRMVFAARGGGVDEAPRVSAEFVNATWRWIARTGSEPVSVPSPDRYTIAFAPNGTYAIRADCNTGRGTFAVDGATVTISPPGLTRAYCGDASLDRTFLAALVRVTRYEVDAQDRLVLIMVDPGERLVFEKAG
jgi:heat shock protein HslJ